MDNEPGSDAVVYRSSMQVRKADLKGADREALLDLAQQRAPDPAVFEEEGNEPFFFTTRASNNKVDSYFTWMADSSLHNYVADATDPGVQFQNSHNGAGTGGWLGGGEAGQVGFGRSLRGKVVGTKNDRSALIDFYTLPGLACGNLTSDQFIRGVRSGIYSDVSIGFMPGKMICNICENDWLKRWDDFGGEGSCTHWPGMTYDIQKGNRTTSEVCTLRVEDGHLNEVSIVYDGATPGAGIVAVDMARLASSRGQLSEFDRTLLENIYRVRINPAQRNWRGVGEGNMDGEDTTTNDDTTVEDPKQESQEPNRAAAGGDGAIEPSVMLDTSDEGEKDETERAAADPMQRLQDKYRGTIATVGSDPYRTIEVFADAIIEQGARIKTLEREAKDGRDFRASLEKALDESVVRAFGADKASEKQPLYREMAKALGIDGVRSLISDLEGQARARLGDGGQMTSVAEKGEGEELDAPATRKPERRGPTPHALLGI